MRITLQINKSIEQNAASYFDVSKKQKKKLAGAKKALVESLKKKGQAELQKPRKTEKKTPRKKEWYEKFRWFLTSDNILVIGGRDATTNEIIVKKHAEKDDFILHTDLQGSPFMVIKTAGKEIPQQSLEEAACFTAASSRAWQFGRTGADVTIAKPEQVTKTAKAGEYVEKGAFIISGKTEHMFANITFAIGLFEGKVMGGPTSAISIHCKDIVEIEQGDEKLSDIAKKIKAKIGGELDEIIRAMPSGGCRLKRRR
ncbi:MAG: NFACT RNA binding domain-containing protein [Nanoarchaeota archaeon]